MYRSASWQKSPTVGHASCNSGYKCTKATNAVNLSYADCTKKAQVHDTVGYGADLCRNGYDDFLGAGEAVPFDPTSFGVKSEDTVMGAALGTGQMTAEEAAAAPEPEPEEEEELSFDEPWIDTAACTTCDDCISINKMMFAYNDDKQAYLKDPTAGTYEDLVRAAEICPAKCIHPGKPLNPNEPNLEELMARAAPFN